MNKLFKSSIRNLNRGNVLFEVKFKGTSSNSWLTRQGNDPYVEKAKMLNYRCRSVFKLMEINQKVNLFQAGQVVIDLGAAPGSWSQLAVSLTNVLGHQKDEPAGTVIAVDRLPIYPIEGAIMFDNHNFEKEETINKLKERLGGIKADIVMSDMAPNATGIRDLDQDGIISLCYKALRFAAQVSKKDASFLTKVWEGPEVLQLELDLERFYKHVKVIKPPASRSDSSEKYLLARGFKGLRE